MELSLDEIDRYLPTYLSNESKEELFRGLEDFPENMESRFYTDKLKNDEDIFQGDGISSLLFYSCKQKSVILGKGLILSNTCDISVNNSRMFPMSIAYIPIYQIEKFQSILREKINDKNKIDNLIYDIKRQHITNFFYLPAHADFPESFARFDQVCSISTVPEIRNELKRKRLFTLSDFGFYLFLLKLSIHFTRIQEHVDRHLGKND